MDIREEARKMKLAAPVLAASSADLRNAALQKIADALKEKKEEIFAANSQDCRAAEEDGISSAVMKRLYFNEAKLEDVCRGIDQLISLPDPVGRSLLRRELDKGLVLERISVPIGVIGVIFEARPDALVQISTLCIKSGNCAILKGGRETARTNRVLFSIIHDAAVSAGLPDSCLVQAELHNEIDELLQCEKDVDLLIPRGSNQFVQYIMNNTKIPVMGHADGICHIYCGQGCGRGDGGPGHYRCQDPVHRSLQCGRNHPRTPRDRSGLPAPSRPLARKGRCQAPRHSGGRKPDRAFL